MAFILSACFTYTLNFPVPFPPAEDDVHHLIACEYE